MNTEHPLTAVIALHISPAPDIYVLQNAIDILQTKHLLLNAGIVNINGVPTFTEATKGKIEVNQSNDREWQTVVEENLNHSIDQAGPLLKVELINNLPENKGIIIVSFHHAIIDGNSARLILDEILHAMADRALQNPSRSSTTLPYLSLRPQNLFKSLSTFFLEQLSEEWIYRKKGFNRVPAPDSTNRIIHRRFSYQFTEALNIRCSKKRLNLNNLILATLTEATVRNKYPDNQSGLVRVINFVDVSSSFGKKLNPEDLGCYVSMLRLAANYDREESIQNFAGKIKKQLIGMGRGNTIRLMAWLSKYLVWFTLKTKTARLGVSALSYIGNLDLASRYGHFLLEDVNAFISNNRYGPEFSAFGKILHGRLGLDFNYLSSETSDDQANKIVDDFEQILSEFMRID